MTYSKDLWAKCRWQFDAIPKGEKCYEFYPELADLFKPIVKAYADTYNSEGINLDILLRYVVLTYHRHSPFATQEQNIIKRKIDVCAYIGLNVEDKSVEQIIANRNLFANSAALYFLKQESNMDWLELQEYLEAFYQIMSALTDGTMQETSKTAQDVAKTKLAIVKDMKLIKAEIETLSAKIFRDDSDLLNHVERFKRAEEEAFVVLSPENYVQKKRRENGA